MRFRRSIVIVILSLMLAGCWDRTEINDLAIVKSVAVDKAERGIRLAVRIVSPRAGPTAARGMSMITQQFAAEGLSIADAAQSLQLQLSRRLFWAHSGPLVIGEELARDGVLPVMDFWSRFSEPRMNAYVIVVPGEAMEFAGADPTMERLLGEAVREVLNMHEDVAVRVRDFLGALHTPGGNPVAPRFERAARAAGEPPHEVRATGAAVFRHDKLVGWLDETDIPGLLLLRDELQTVMLPVDLPGGARITVRIIRSNTTTHAFSQGGRIGISVKVIAEGDVLDSNAMADLSKPEVLILFERGLIRALEQRMRSTLDKVQKEYGLDVLKLGDAVRRDMPFTWDGGLKDRWDEEFSRVAVTLYVDAYIRRTGGNGAPLGQRSTIIKKATGDLLREMR